MEAPYFSEKEANLLWDAYEKYYGRTINEEIRKDMYHKTQGSQGLTVIVTQLYDDICGVKQSISPSDWNSTSEQSWKKILEDNGDASPSTGFKHYVIFK